MFSRLRGKKRNPYIRVRLGPGKETRSTVIRVSGTSVTWEGEVLKLILPEAAIRTRPLNFELWDSNSPGKDTLLGTVPVRIDSMVARAEMRGRTLNRNIAFT